MLAWGEHSSRPVYIISVPGQSVPAGMPCQHSIFSCWATYIQIFFGKIHNIVTTTVTNSTNVEPVSYIYIIKPTGCQNNPGRVFPLDASASIPVLVHHYRRHIFSHFFQQPYLIKSLQVVPAESLAMYWKQVKAWNIYHIISATRSVPENEK